MTVDEMEADRAYWFEVRAERDALRSTLAALPAVVKVVTEPAAAEAAKCLQAEVDALRARVAGLTAERDEWMTKALERLRALHAVMDERDAAARRLEHLKQLATKVKEAQARADARERSGG